MTAVNCPSTHHHWTTDAVERRHALAYWVDTVCDRFLALDIEAPAREGFRAHLDQVELGATSANFIHADRQLVRRTRAKIARSSHAMYVLLQLRQGQIALQQQGREALIRPGECVFINAAEPYRLDSPGPTQALALRLPATWLQQWVPRPEGQAARLFAGAGWNGALNAALLNLQVDSCTGLALPAATVAEQLAALLALAIGREGAPTAPRPLLDRLKAHLRERLHEPDLSPAGVADALNISLRALHYAFAGARSTFGQELTALRMQRARQLLSDPRAAGLAVLEVALRCGFSDPSHFARRFRQHTGSAPAQFRLQHGPHRH